MPDDKIILKVRPLADLAIGSLGDLAGDLAMIRRQLHGLKDKEVWTAEEMAKFKSAISRVASFCNVDIAEWEDQTNVWLPNLD